MGVFFQKKLVGSPNTYNKNKSVRRGFHVF